MKPEKKSDAPNQHLDAVLICTGILVLPLMVIGAAGGINACREDFHSGQVSVKHLAVTACNLGFLVLLCVQLVKAISRMIRESRIRRQKKTDP